MAYRICRTFEIENGHMLSKHPEKCRFPHGHSRRIECVLEAASLDERDMVCDFKLIRKIIAEFLETFDHAMCMNTADPAYETFRGLYGDRVIPFEDQDPTTEVMARMIFDTLEEKMLQHRPSPGDLYRLRPGEVKVVRVRVWETAHSWAEYERN